MGNYSGFFSSCTFCVHVIEKPFVFTAFSVFLVAVLFTAPTRLLRIYARYPSF